MTARPGSATLASVPHPGGSVPTVRPPAVRRRSQSRKSYTGGPHECFTGNRRQTGTGMRIVRGITRQEGTPAMNTTQTVTPAPTAAPTCDGDHWMRTPSGKFQWCLADECIVHGANAEIGL